MICNRIDATISEKEIGSYFKMYTFSIKTLMKYTYVLIVELSIINYLFYNFDFAFLAPQQ